MAVPKRKHSKARTAKRRANWKLTSPQLVECPQCHAARLPHHACSECGNYNDREVKGSQSS
ncbi:MAG TPA: 50S ribosomal protein L32 [Firmicutes bacterium]|nr:50S ribosomal protein L32 [Bacillota bacterium]